jgi:hypothetical protein
MTKEINRMKCVVVVADTLPSGLAANAAAVITMALTRQVEALIGPDVKDGDGALHPGIALIPVPILAAAPARIAELRLCADADPALVCAGFSTLAQSCRNYPEYIDRMAATMTEDLEFIAIGVVGPSRSVNRLAASLPLLR